MKNSVKIMRAQKCKVLLTLFCVLSFMGVNGQPGGGPVPASISMGQIVPLSYCAGDSMWVPYIDDGTYTATNVFTAELSDAYGDFSSPVILGTSITQGGGIIPCVIPMSTPTGYGYRVRVVASEPFIISDDNGEDIEIKSKPVVIFSGTFPDQCENNTTLDLTSYAVVSPAGGQFSGPGVTGVNFSAFAAGSAGSPHTIVYTYSDGIGCSNSATNQIVVLAFPSVSISNLGTFYCTNFHSLSLNGNPAGGTFSGPGVNGNLFSPMLAGVGTHVITYSYSAPNGCSDVYSQTVVVDECSYIDNNENVNKINIYPNPSNGKFNIEISGTGMSDVSVYSIYGSQLQKFNIIKGERQIIDVSYLSSGIYFIKIDNKISILEIKN